MARTSSLILLLSFLTGPVTMATGLERGVSTCREVHPELIRELWIRTRQLLCIIPTEEKPSRRARLLPKFCTQCQEGTIGWLEIREMIDIYQRSVFSQDEVKTLLPLHFPELLYRLQSTLHNCRSECAQLRALPLEREHFQSVPEEEPTCAHVPTGKPSQWSKMLKKLEKKIKKRKHNGVLKAVGEFPFLLRWTGELAHQRVF